MKKYYHYTIEERVQIIIDSGQINLAKACVHGKKEKAVAWVSSNEKWESTSNKGYMDFFGNQKTLTFNEQSEHFGCGRIVVKPIGFMTWAKLIHKAKMDKEMAYRMENTGKKVGAKPSEWFGSLHPIKKDKWISAEVFKNGKWIEVESFV